MARVVLVQRVVGMELMTKGPPNGRTGLPALGTPRRSPPSLLLMIPLLESALNPESMSMWHQAFSMR